MIYLDSASTTSVSTKYKEIIDKYLYENYGNAGSIHSLGIKSKEAIEKARNQIAEAVNTEKENVIFTSSGSEANSLAIVGLISYLKYINKTHIITSKYEHHSVLNAFQALRQEGFDVTYLDIVGGQVSIDDLRSAIRTNTGLVSIMYVNNEIGTKNNVQEFYNICKQNDIMFHCDCVQALGVEKIDMQEIADFISISGHKIHAPKGIGALCANNKYKLSNIIFGGEQEFGIRPGTENVAAIAAFGQAASEASEVQPKVLSKLFELSNAFDKELRDSCSSENIKMHYSIEDVTKIPKIRSVRFDDIDANTLVLFLSNNDVFVSAGSACSSHSNLPSHVLKSIGLTDEEAKSTIRISFSDENTVEEVIEAARIIVRSVKLLSMVGDSK